jgi:phosphorylcholine metabolism protein LicD
MIPNNESTTNPLFDSWGCTTKENIKHKIERTQKYKPELIKLANHVNDILKRYSLEENIKWFLMDGTLLGAYRDGQMIEHDYDFDYGIYCTEEQLKTVQRYMDQELKTHNPNYVCELIDSYSYKIQIYDPSHGTHFLGNDWYNVSLDLQLYTDHPADNDCLRIAYYKEGYDKLFKFKKQWFFPLSGITFEHSLYPAPLDPGSVLREIYGYIGKGGVFNKETKRYDAPK